MRNGFCGIIQVSKLHQMQQGSGDLLFGEHRFFIHKTCFRKFCQKTHLMDGPFLGDEVRPDQAMIHRG